jgi:hypothetical protein
MANETRHAAWQTERSFAVRLLPEEGLPADLASGLTEFLDAFDLASEWLSREDPARDGSATLAILETRDGVTEEVWTYPAVQTGNDQDLVGRLGFNPLTWAGVPEYSSYEQKSRLRQRVWPVADRAPTVLPSPAQPVASPEPEIDRTEPAAARETPRRWIRPSARAAWDDRLSRCCLIAAGASLWFSVGLADPQFLLPLLGFGPALWWRQRNRDASAPEADIDDWL